MVKPRIRRNAPVLGFVLVVALVGAVAGSGATRSTGVRVGQPWTGSAGIRRTTQQIMRLPKRVVGRHAALRALEAKRELKPNPNAPSGSGPKVGTALATSGPKLSVGASFTGATLNEEGTDFANGYVPPDTDGAVGPTQFLVAVNGAIRLFDKSGNPDASLQDGLTNFFSPVLPAGSDTSDPHVRYDPTSGEWIVVAIEVNANLQSNRILLAVGEDSTITGSTTWDLYAFQQDAVSTTGDSLDLADYPTLGVDANGIYVGANMFDFHTDPSNPSFVNSSVFVIRKSSVIHGGSIVVTAFRDLENSAGAGPFAPAGVDNTDPAATSGYFVGVDNEFLGVLDVRRVGTPGGTPTLSGNLQVNLSQTDFDFFPQPVTVPGSTLPLDSGDWRITQAELVNGKLYAAQGIGTDSAGNGSDTPTRDAARWYELTNLSTTPTLNRFGTIFDSASSSPSSFFMPSMAVSRQGHALIGMTSASSTARPSAAYASMLSGTSSFSTPTNYATSPSVTYNPSFDAGPNSYRWGDFSTTSVDPCDGQTFWTIQEYVDDTDSWGVKVAKIAAPPPATPASTSPTSINDGATSVSVTLTGTSSSGSGFWDPGSGSCRISASVDGGVTVNSVTYTNPTHITLNLNTVGATGGAHTVTITNPDGQTASASVLTVNTKPVNTALPTITGTVTKGQTLTAAPGTWNAIPSPTFAYQWQRCTAPGTCSNITGATASTYILASADVGLTIRLRVTATNVAGSTAADSAETTAVTAAPANTALPTITGLTQVGATLTEHDGTWTGSPTPTFTYQWEQCNNSGASCTNIVGETSNTYLVAAGDAGKTIRVKVTGTNTVSSSTAESAATAVITVPPSNDSPPTVTGTAAVGQLLTGHDGTWSGVPAPTLSRQWRRCDTAGANCTNIAGATASTYTPVQADAGSTIRFRVTGTSTSGTTIADSDPTSTVIGPPVVATIPTISGTASRGQLLTEHDGTFTGFPAPTLSYQWKQCDSAGANCTLIVGATSTTYTPVSGDEGKTIRVAVTATNGSGSATATSNQTSVVTGSPQNTAAPTLSGTAELGQKLTTSNGTWTGFPASFTFTYAWFRCDSGGANCSAIGGATASSYTLVQADVGGTVKSRVTASNGVAPTASQDSAVTAIVAGAPANTAAPTITGTPADGQTLTEHDGTWSGYPTPLTFTYQWKRCDSIGANCADIAGENNNTYVVDATTDAGYRIRVTVTATNTKGSASADSDTADVPGDTVNLTAPTITGTAQVGATLTAHTGSWTGVPAPTFTYQWQRCDSAGANCVDIVGATHTTYQPVTADIGSTLVVEVSADNTGTPTAPVASAATLAVVAAPSGGGGGGGSGTPPDVVASISASPANPGIGSTLTYTVQASILTGNATDVVATINLPAQVTFVSATADRGSGCTGTTTLTCDLNLLSGTLVATVQVVTQVNQAGTLVATASMTTTPGDSNTANNTATSTITVAAPPPPPPPPPPALPAPKLKRIGTNPLVGVRHIGTETVDARFTTNENLQLSATVTPLRSTRKLSMLKKSRLAGSTANSSRLTLRGTARRAGTYAVHLVLSPRTFVKGHTYVIHLTAVNAKGKRTTITLRFKA